MTSASGQLPDVKQAADSKEDATLLDGLIAKIRKELPHALQVAAHLERLKPVFENDFFRVVDEQNTDYPLASTPAPSFVMNLQQDPLVDAANTLALADADRKHKNRVNPHRPELFLQNLYLAIKLPDQERVEAVNQLFEEYNRNLVEALTMDDGVEQQSALAGANEGLMRDIADFAEITHQFLRQEKLDYERWQREGEKIIDATITSQLPVDNEKAKSALKKKWSEHVKKVGEIGFFDVSFDSNVSDAKKTFAASLKEVAQTAEQENESLIRKHIFLLNQDLRLAKEKIALLEAEKQRILDEERRKITAISLDLTKIRTSYIQSKILSKTVDKAHAAVFQQIDAKFLKVSAEFPKKLAKSIRNEMKLYLIQLKNNLPDGTSDLKGNIDAVIQKFEAIARVKENVSQNKAATNRRS